ncbi:amino acid permease [Francisella tularensis]|uniref:Serine transporter n=3 Tax=Francisella tularensis TaxID=263 RepID=Q5NGW5_FRATT|nr:serine transporter [Francisella tularensis]ADA78398.1 serine transporter [Francisella tularensis subsp. tularensis NE061598]AFB78835.1 Serine transporter [Francisella tularensis subsp. tularensis TIGB03]AFB80380.1 Serine transporter [Francisella tularensis subsp. tularensis TI0902]AJI69210.1 tryptophan/tyrosine permease family protein [Francisella tularensis subsp. tularensis SCHU S4]AJI71748.1 tryptophan/tyrosine permease family protein [Francisella tularensis subsp. tularensis]
MKKPDYSNTTKVDIQWVFTLFGTAIGAGLLYLPVQAGDSGLWALVTVLIFALPLTYYSHKNMSNIVLCTDNGGITDVFTHNLGRFFGLTCVVLYFFAIFLNMPMYSIGLNSELSNFLLNYNIVKTNLSTHIWFSFSILAVLLIIVSLGINIILKFMQLIVILLIILVVTLSIYIIPYWNFEFITDSHFDTVGYITGVLMVLPILILSMNHSPVISNLVIFYRDYVKVERSQEKYKVYKILKINALILFIFVLLFVTSCLLSTTIPDLNRANANNLTIVTLIQEQHHSTLLNILAPMIVFTAIISSFIGCYIGSKEALKYLFKYFFKNIYKIEFSDSLINKICVGLIFIVLWICTICNFKILNIIGILVAPTVAFLLYVLPVIIIYKNIQCKDYRRVILDSILFIMGLIIIFGHVIGLLLK